ncbi:CpaF family protein [Candidatus Nitronereus thalassa]|uniref:CpaF family protein n=1 Tax=Candidatus Nitronereus thalassa TaxID=3020898 RepID=A0ABU3KAK5_9BACT|nr:CpaF family protein [Candidatus Nitronereus thalassa]MDT7043451.1 CpaF family protein [Candidatus Nitronereus thalassa]
MFSLLSDHNGHDEGLPPLGVALGNLKTRLHRQVVETLDLSVISRMDATLAKFEVSQVVERILDRERIPLNRKEREQLIVDIHHEVMGLGPLEPLLHDPTVNDILVNGAHQVYVERRGRLELSDVQFRSEAHLRKIIERIVSAVGRRIDESSPMVDARLADGSRINAIIPPLALDGACLSIRRFMKDKLQVEDLIAHRALTPEMVHVLEGAVKARLNILVSGGTGSGKTTLLNVLSGYIPAEERIVTIEDSAELQLRQKHVVRLETRPGNIEGKGEVTQRELVKNCLRMRPDRIVLGEVRGNETLDMLQAMNTGHDGSLTTIHANSPRDALARVETLVSLAGLNISTKALRQYISSALDVVVQMTRFSDGTRRVTSLQEITGMEGETVTMQEIFRFEQTGLDSAHRTQGRFVSTGVRPRFMDQLKIIGMDEPMGLFNPNHISTV